MRRDVAHSGSRPRSSRRRIGCSVIVMTSAMKTGPTISAMDLTPARAIVRAATPKSRRRGEDPGRRAAPGGRGGVLHGVLLSRPWRSVRMAHERMRHRVMSRPWAVSAQMTKMSTAMMVSRPERVVGDEGEVRQGAEDGQDDADRAPPDLAVQHREAGEQHQQPHQQVDPAPAGGVELEQVVGRGDVEVVLEQRRHAGQRLEAAGHDHHDAGEHDEPGGQAAGRSPAGRRRGSSMSSARTWSSLLGLR